MKNFFIYDSRESIEERKSLWTWTTLTMPSKGWTMLVMTMAPSIDHQTDETSIGPLSFDETDCLRVSRVSPSESARVFE